jgi:hypothetical protein
MPWMLSLRIIRGASLCRPCLPCRGSTLLTTRVWNGVGISCRYRDYSQESIQRLPAGVKPRRKGYHICHTMPPYYLGLGIIKVCNGDIGGNAPRIIQTSYMASLAWLTTVNLALLGHGSVGRSTFCLLCRALIRTVGEVF